MAERADVSGGCAVTAFGAAGDGRTTSTGPIQKAIDAAASAGGGTVVVPPGVYRTGTIFVRSNVRLYLTAGATLRGSPDWADYPPVAYSDGGGAHRHLVVVQDARNVAIEGPGLIDGGGEAFHEPPDDDHSWIRAKRDRPGAMLAVVCSQDVRLLDVRLTNPSDWVSDLYRCDRVFVRGVSMVNDPRRPNNDGIDISGCHDVLISDCLIDTGDDGIVINTRPRDTRRVVVTNCTIRSESAALKIGWEYTKHDIRQIAFSNCVIHGSNRGVAFYTCNGAAIEDVSVSNLVFDSNGGTFLPRPIHMDLRRGRETGTFGAIRNVMIAGMAIRTQGRILMTSQEGGCIENVTLRDVRMAYPYVEDPSPIASGATSSQSSNCNPDARAARAAVVVENIRGLVIDELHVEWPGAETPADWRVPVKRENGGRRLFRPDYSDPRPCEFAVLWGRGLRGGRLAAPEASPSSPSVPKYDLAGSNIATDG